MWMNFKKLIEYDFINRINFQNWYTKVTIIINK
jgi:hypothetical protein